MTVKIQKYGVRLIRENEYEYKVNFVANSPESVCNILKTVFDVDSMTQENLMLLTLDTKNKINGAFIVSTGTLNSSLVHPRDIFQRALLVNAAAIIIAHNHPSGDPTPSRDDRETTKRIKQCGEFMGVPLLDHIIMGENHGSYVSMKEIGLI